MFVLLVRKLCSCIMQEPARAYLLSSLGRGIARCEHHSWNLCFALDSSVICQPCGSCSGSDTATVPLVGNTFLGLWYGTFFGCLTPSKSKSRVFTTSTGNDPSAAVRDPVLSWLHFYQHAVQIWSFDILLIARCLRMGARRPEASRHTRA